MLGVEVADGLVEADHPLLDDVLAVGADQEVRARLDPGEGAVLGEQLDSAASSPRAGGEHERVVGGASSACGGRARRRGGPRRRGRRPGARPRAISASSACAAISRAISASTSAAISAATSSSGSVISTSSTRPVSSSACRAGASTVGSTTRSSVAGVGRRLAGHAGGALTQQSHGRTSRPGRRLRVGAGSAQGPDRPRSGDCTTVQPIGEPLRRRWLTTSSTRARPCCSRTAGVRSLTPCRSPRAAPPRATSASATAAAMPALSDSVLCTMEIDTRDVAGLRDQPAEALALAADHEHERARSRPRGRRGRRRRRRRARRRTARPPCRPSACG